MTRDEERMAVDFVLRHVCRPCASPEVAVVAGLVLPASEQAVAIENHALEIAIAFVRFVLGVPFADLTVRSTRDVFAWRSLLVRGVEVHRQRWVERTNPIGIVLVQEWTGGAPWE